MRKDEIRKDEPGFQKRRFIRVRLPGPCAYMEIVRIYGKDVHASGKPVILRNLSPGGLRFSTDLEFPVGRQLVLRFSMRLLDQTLRLEGHIVWKGVMENLNEYGVEFAPDERRQKMLIRLLNQWLLIANPEQNRIHRLYGGIREMKKDGGNAWN